MKRSTVALRYIKELGNVSKKQEFPIPIFSVGKEDHIIYNKLILKTLLTKGESKPWELAMEIAPKIPSLNETIQSTKTQKAFSVLIRKDGRLDDLTRKEYIRKNERQKYELRLKGLAAILTLEPDLAPKLSSYYRSEVIKFRPDDLDIQPFLSYEGRNSKALEDLYSGIEKNPRFYVILAEQTRKMILKGINLDAIREEDFGTMLFNGILEPFMQELFLAILKQKPNIKKLDLGSLLTELLGKLEKTL